ncbi:MAG: cytochrome c biogenesis protein CcsA [Bdellovibrionales bacterium]|nr:cytochrome c biogenesis protein CcsA [Bdellovibrionales bacterium]
MKLLGVLLLALFSSVSLADIGRPLENLAIQDAGRVKPLGTFAQESLQLIYGKKTFEGKSATEVVFTWLLIPDHWIKQPVVEIRHHGLKEALNITSPGKYFSPEELFGNPRLGLILQELQNQRTRQEKLNPYYQAVARLENQLALFRAIFTGVALRLVPDPATDTWKAVPDLDGPMREAFQRISKGFVDSISNSPVGSKPKPSAELQAAVDDFIAQARSLAPEKYGDNTKLKMELHLNHFHPFKWAWVCYLIAFLCMVAAMGWGSRAADRGGWIFLLVGFALHTYGMALRSYISGRPPVSNMYETVIWVPWGVLLFAMILERVQKNKMLTSCAAVVAIFCLILTDLAPTVLDKSLHPLEPVLRSTFWLSTHVLIITISYAAFFLAFALGDLVLFYYLKDEQKYARQIQSATQSIYRSIQIGVVLLAFGIILGGIWADYSWGRFWGWDPKETWALIALLGYLALLHCKLVGLVRGFGMAAGSIVAFALVIMAWYGVNMVLGAGLHTYGFGAGGVEYVTAFVVAHLLYVTYVSAVRYPRSKIQSK